MSSEPAEPITDIINPDTQLQSNKYPPNRIVGLQPFKPGQSGNPGGFPKGAQKISTAYQRLMLLSPQELAEFVPKTVGDEIALARIQGARGIRGLAETVEITDRTEGKARQVIDVNDVSELERLVIRVQERVLAQTGRELPRDQALDHVLSYRPDLAQLK